MSDAVPRETPPLFSPLDEHFAHAMMRMVDEDDTRVWMAAALVSRQLGHGHVCLDLSQVGAIVAEAGVAEPPAPVPKLAAWLEALRASALVGHGAEATPLVLDEDAKLYLHRYWQHEERLAATILARARAAPPRLDRARMNEGLDRMFGREVRRATDSRQLGLFEQEPDLQRDAARVALERNLCVITGGPGTGKTSTVARLLALLVEQASALGEAPPRVELLAPTGKAAARLSEAIESLRGELPCAPEVRDAIALQARTIHRALGVRPNGGFAHDREHPLAADVVIVDEASMVDLALMARLFDAIAPEARVILLGDRDQLASVEAGAVLGDICGERRASGPLSGCIVELKRSYRYATDSGIGALARAVRAGDEAAALDALSGRFEDVALVQAPLGTRHLWPELRGAVQKGFAGCFVPEAPVAERLLALERFRVLCAHRRGPRGLVDLNTRIEAALLSAGVAQQRDAFVPGTPVLVTQNDYALRLFNGDVGILLFDEETKARRAGFLDAEGAERQLALARLPPHEPVYATSVHKSQGSELDEVAIVLPEEASPLTSRELLYTAITRARQRATIYASTEVLTRAIRTRVQRASGLRARLWDRS